MQINVVFSPDGHAATHCERGLLKAEAGGELEAGVGGGGVQRTAGPPRIDPFQLRRLQAGGHVDDGPRPQEQDGAALVGPHQQIWTEGEPYILYYQL